MKSNLIKMSVKLIIMVLLYVLVLSALTACESIEFLLEQNEKYEEEAKAKEEEEVVDKKTNKKTESLSNEQSDRSTELVSEDEFEDEINLSDELIAADGLIINRELVYESYIGRRGQSIIEELFVVRRDSEHQYGDVLNYNGNKFFCNKEDVCYAIYIKNDTILDLKFPIARTSLVEIMGPPVLSNDEYEYYSYLEHMIRVPSGKNEVKECVVAKNMDGLVAFMISFNEEASYMLDEMLLNNRFEILSELGPVERESLGEVEVMHYDYQGIYIQLKGEKNKKLATKVLVTRYGGFGIDIGLSKDLLDSYYIEAIYKSDFYIYQYEDTYYSVFFDDDVVVAIQVMTKEEAELIKSETKPLEWADLGMINNKSE